MHFDIVIEKKDYFQNPKGTKFKKLQTKEKLERSTESERQTMIMALTNL